MARFISVEADVSEVQDALAGTSKSLVSIRRQMLGIIARGVSKETSKAIRATTEKRTGELRKAYRYKVRRDGSEANVFPKGLKGSDRSIFPKVMALNYGTVDGRLKPLGFIEQGEKYAESDKYSADVDKMIQRELKKYWG